MRDKAAGAGDRPLPPPREGAATVALAVLTGRIAAELGQMSAITLDLQGALSALLGEQLPRSMTVAGLQSIDRVSQQLGDLARLMHVLAAASPADATIPAAQIRDSMQLSDLARRLVAESLPVHPGPALHATGDVQWL